MKIYLTALCWSILFVANAQTDILPCKAFIFCKWESSNKTYRFCSNNLPKPEEFCKSFFWCLGSQDGTNSDAELKEEMEHNICKDGIARVKRQAPHNYKERNSAVGRKTRSDPKGGSNCPDPGFISNAVRHTIDGSLSSTSRTFEEGELVIYACRSDEFALQGKAFLRCTSEGSWSSPLPWCFRPSSSEGVTCPDPGYIPNGYRFNINGTMSNTARPYEIGQSVLYACQEGFALQPHSLITCMAEGRWSKSKPHCIRSVPEEPEQTLAFCEDPGLDPNGDRTPRRPLMSRGFMQGTRLEYFCYEGYILRGEEELFCLNTGKWSSEAPTCDSDIFDATACNNPGPILNGKVTPKKMEYGDLEEIESALQYPVGTTLEYSCHPNHVLEGKPFIVCEDFGAWSAQPPNCFPKCGVSYADGTSALDEKHTSEVNSVEEWPWGVSMSRDKNENVMCNAALLNANAVITAANCVENLTTVFLYFGRKYKNVSSDDSDLTVRVSAEIKIHPKFNATSREYDVAIVKFAPKIRYTEKILPICLPTKESTERNLKIGNIGYVAGFSHYFPYRKSPNNLMIGKLKVQGNEECQFLARGPFCGGSYLITWTTCFRNGAAFVFYDSKEDTYTLEGITCNVYCPPDPRIATFGRYATFFQMTEVQLILSWIHEIIES